MEKTKWYRNTLFTVETFKSGIERFDATMKESELAHMQAERKMFNRPEWKQPELEKLFENPRCTLSIETDTEKWAYDSEDEFFADYRKCTPDAPKAEITYCRYRGISEFCLYKSDNNTTRVGVKATRSSDCRSLIEKVFDAFETAAPKAKLLYKTVPKPKIFIGHGRSNLWRDLKDHLHDKQGFEIIAYEVGARAGHTVRDILGSMLSESSLALLVMTPEDETADGNFRARQNVIHETGLFQGKLGFNRAIVLLEDGTEEFSNINGVEQIRFSKGNIKETYGDVLATIKREFY